MVAALRSLRVRFALLTFVAIYLPVAVLFLVVQAQDASVEIDGDVRIESVDITTGPSTEVLVTTLALLPVAALFAWWLSGLAIRPITAAIAVQRRLVEEASHELRTPLAVLTNNAEVLLSHPDPDLATFREGIERSGTAAVRMSETIDALLVDARGRARTIDRAPTDLVGLCRGVVEHLGGDADAADMTLIVEADGPVSAAVDQASVGRAVTNLVHNAINHSGGSTVVVRVTGPSRRPGRVRPGTGGRGDSTGPVAGDVVISVIDDGGGIPVEEHDRIFERFWTGDRDGTGLGLSIARQIAQAHGGSLTVETPVADGRGTRFSLHLRP
ncbi:MAG: HAMP domain-containing sensor histidine kinase [Actinomycetota bacterium]